MSVADQPYEGMAEHLPHVTGRGFYIDDLQLPEMLHAAVLRSPHAHAVIRHIDVEQARALPGVHGVFTHADLGEAGRPVTAMATHPAIRALRTACPLARDKVRYVGEPVALVVAEDRYTAEDALELIIVEYDPLPAVADAEAEPEEGALVHDDVPDNVAGVIRHAIGDVDGALRQADLVIELTLRLSRACGQPIETRGIVAQYEPRGRMLNVWCATQKPQQVRMRIAEMLGLPEHRVRLMTPRLGGGFGPKGRFYSEYILVPWAAVRLGRPVKYIEDRCEHLLAALQEREQVHHVQAAVRSDGVLLGLRDRFRHDVGAYIDTGLAVPAITAEAIPGPYRLAHYEVEGTCVYTHRVPTAPVRGAGRQHAVFVMEQIMEEIARRLDLDPAEVRRRNLIGPSEMPYRLGLMGRHGREMVYDSGNYPECLRQVLEGLDYDAFRREQPDLWKRGIYRGVGLAMFVEATGLGPPEGATVRVEPSGRVVVAMGPPSSGQSHETTMAKICARELGVERDAVEVVAGDTALIPEGSGTHGSRIGVLVGNAVALAARDVRRQVLEEAAEMLGVDASALRMERGVIWRGEENTGLTLRDVARRASALRPRLPAHRSRPSLVATRFFAPQDPAFTSGAHGVMVEVDVELGDVKILKYVVVDDCGNPIDPVVCHGQVMGGLVQGIGEAFYERVAFTADGQPLVTSLMDYYVPTVFELPRTVHIRSVVSPAPGNPLGLKGVGEGGGIPVAAAFCLAVQDALRPLNVSIDRAPIDPVALWEALQRNRSLHESGEPAAEAALNRGMGLQVKGERV